MNNESVILTRPRPSPFDILLVIIGPVMLAAGIYMLTGSLEPVVLGIVAGCVLGTLAWHWPRILGPVLLVLSIPVLAISLFLTLYTGGMPNWLVTQWGSLAFLIGGVGVLRWRSAARRPVRHIAVQAAWVGSLAAAFILYVVILWPPQGKTILLSLPIMKQAVAPPVQLGAGGVWAACWTAPSVPVTQALESVTNLLQSDGWSIVDTASSPQGVLISAQRKAYALEIIYNPAATSHYCSTGVNTGAYLAAYIRQAKASRFAGFDYERWCGLAIMCETIGN